MEQRKNIVEDQNHVEFDNIKNSMWEYSRYRATLMKDGKFFALVTPDGVNALSEQDAKKLLDALNGHTIEESGEQEGIFTTMFKVYF